jgi:2-polyprenyl-6-hydroxyphenyl methylase/3-demethylubiquinone-9 3-methyltransferase
MFSTYSEKFWQPRLDWFEKQAELGLLGKIDYQKTGGGIIVCHDGFTATTVSPDEFRSICSEAKADFELREVDDSSLFCLLTKAG